MREPSRTLYLDHHATTPLEPRVLEAMMPFLTTFHGNPSGTETPSGRRAQRAVETARGQVAHLLNALPKEIIFTSGATEANNLAIIGVAKAMRGRSDRRRIVTTSIEHKAVLQSMNALSKEGFEVLYVPITYGGRVDLNAAADMIDDRVLLVSVQVANNEIGTVQPIRELSELAHERGGLIHCDGAQAVGNIPTDVTALNVDLLSLSAHKFYGPKGTGALYVRNGPRNFPLAPQTYGGGQEQGFRSGTINVPGVVGLGSAAEIATHEMPRHATHVSAARDTFERVLVEGTPSVRINGDKEHRLPNNCSVSFAGVDASALIQQLPELEVSTGSACTAGAQEPSYVLEAVGLTRSEAYSTVRFGWGRGQTVDDAVFAATRVREAVEVLRSMIP